MKCIINNVEVNAKVTENMGFQGGYNVKAVEYKGYEYIVVKKGGIWVQRSPAEKLV